MFTQLASAVAALALVQATPTSSQCDTSLWSLELLQFSQRQVQQGLLQEPLDALLVEADGWLERSRSSQLFTVISKPETPSSTYNCSKRCFYSLGTYWWPNNNTADGLPYVRYDGLVNPETFKFDSVPLSQVIFAISNLSLAYFFTGNESFASGAAAFTDAFFLDPVTGMDPVVGLEHAQALPGHGKADAGRNIGIIDAKDLAYVFDAGCLLAGSRSWGSSSSSPSGTPRGAALRAWGQSYRSWIKSSQHAVDEFHKTNNHGTWFDVQAFSIALTFGDDVDVALYAQDALERVRVQIEPNGTMPQELSRSRPFHYTWWNMQAFFELAFMARRGGADVFKTEVEGRSLRRALDWVLPYATGAKDFPLVDETPFDHGKFFQVFRMAALVWPNASYESAIPALSGNVNYTTNVLNLLWPQAGAIDASTDIIL